jgi:NitT/TauT family transport system permease protein/taurine transport system permease protein
MSLSVESAPVGSPLFTVSQLRRFNPFRLRYLKRFGMILLSILTLLAGWAFLSTFVVDPFLIPPPWKVAKAFIPMSASGDLFRDIFMSLQRVFIGYITGVAFAITAGLFMGRLKLLNDLGDPIVEFLRFLSPTAMIPIAVIWFGIGETAKYFLVFWGTIFIVMIATIAGVARTPKARQNAALCLGASEAQIFRLIVLPSAIPSIVTGLRLALASSFLSIIPAELLAADSGLGYLLQQSSLMLQTDRIFVALVTISLVGFLTDRLFRVLIQIVCRRYLIVS